MIITWKGQKVYVAGWEPNAPPKCEMCHRLASGLRPYGENGAWICVDCAGKNTERTEKAMHAAMDPADFVVNPGGELPPFSEQEMLSLLDEWLSQQHEAQA